VGKSGSRWARDAVSGDFANVGEGLAPPFVSVKAAEQLREKPRERYERIRPGS
jgi:hypothetical protein